MSSSSGHPDIRWCPLFCLADATTSSLFVGTSGLGQDDARATFRRNQTIEQAIVVATATLFVAASRLVRKPSSNIKTNGCPRRLEASKWAEQMEVQIGV